MSSPLIKQLDKLTGELDRLRFSPPVAYTYNPLQYARRSWLRYMRFAANGSAEVLLLGMNPGPWGMAQTGVPFGAVGMVTDWLGIREKVGKPAREHPKRPILGFDCHREEVSGKRLWGWAKAHFGTPERFFKRFFVWNYCPLLFLADEGRNITPDKLATAQRKPLFELCDEALRCVVAHLRPAHVIGIGVFAERRAHEATAGRVAHIGRILHPSPASPAANRNWAEQATDQLARQGIVVPAPKSPVATPRGKRTPTPVSNRTGS